MPYHGLEETAADKKVVRAIKIAKALRYFNVLHEGKFEIPHDGSKPLAYQKFRDKLNAVLTDVDDDYLEETKGSVFGNVVKAGALPEGFRTTEPLKGDVRYNLPETPSHKLYSLLQQITEGQANELVEQYAEGHFLPLF